MRFGVVVVWAVAFARVEVMVVCFLRGLFGLQYHHTFVPAEATASAPPPRGA